MFIFTTYLDLYMLSKWLQPEILCEYEELRKVENGSSACPSSNAGDYIQRYMYLYLCYIFYLCISKLALTFFIHLNYYEFGKDQQRLWPKRSDYLEARIVVALSEQHILCSFLCICIYSYMGRRWCGTIIF